MTHGPRRVARWLRLLVGCGLTGVVVLLSPGVASAHAALESSTPGNGKVLATAPTEVTLTFGEPVEIALGGLRVIDADGHRVDDGQPAHPLGHSEQVVVGLHELPPGTYLATWRVVSADSHAVAGAFTFSVGAAGRAPKAISLTGSRATGLVLGFARFFALAGVVVSIGSVAFRLLVRAGPVSPAHALRPIPAALAVTALASLAQFLLQGPYEAGLGPSRAFDASLAAVVGRAPFGQAVALRLAGLGIVACCLPLLAGARAHRRPPWWGIALVTVGLLVTATGFSATGHARAQGGVHLLLDVVHVGAAGIWLGGLVTLALLLRAGVDVLPELSRWSAVAATCVAVLVMSGVTAGGLETRSVDALIDTTYGRLLLVKSVLLAAALVLADVARRRIVAHGRGRAAMTGDSGPQGDPGSDGRHAALGVVRTVGRSVVLESGLAVVVLVATTMLVQTQPAVDAYAPIYDRFTKVHGMTVQTTVEPAIAGSNELHVYVTDGTGRAIDVPEIRATFALPAADIAPLPTALHWKSPGHWEDLEVSLPQRGAWSLHIDIRTTDIDEDALDEVVPLR